MNSRFSTKTIVGALIVSLLAPSALFLYPSPAKADSSSCAAVVAGAIASIPVLAGVEKALGVTTSQPSNASAGALTGGSSFGQFFKDCVLTPIAINLAKQMLRNITSSIVNWINSGFQGNPSFVQDIHGMVTDATDQAIGGFIEHDLGLGFLCSPFSLQVKIAVAQSYLPYRQRSACTLSQIQNNVNNFGQNGWDDWLQVTTNPNNNVYGATVIAQNELSKAIIDKLQTQKWDLDWGKGFRSFKKCESDAEVTARLNNESTSKGGAFYTSYSKATLNDKRQCPTVTPGSVVESQLNRALNTDISQLEIANDIDAIMGALTNQLMSKVITGAQGLLGAGRNANGSYNSTKYNPTIPTSSGDPSFDSAVTTGVDQISSTANLSALSIQIEDTGTTTEEATTTDASAGAQTQNQAQQSLSWVVATSTQKLSFSYPFNYETDLTANFATTSLVVRTSLTRNGSRYPYLAVFGSLDINFGRSDGTIVHQTVSDNQTGEIKLTGASVSPRARYRVIYAGERGISANPPAGAYTIKTTVENAQGEILGTEEDSFMIE